MFWKLFYNIAVVPVGWFLFRLLGLFSAKVRRGIAGRRGLFEKLAADAGRLRPGSKRVWFHSSSMGEFEQARPIIAELVKRRPDIDIIISFFSPSGYDHSLTYRNAAIITYLPFDSASNAGAFIDCIRPDAAVMVRYDVWPNHLWALKKRGIPVFIANATFRMTAVRRFLPVRSFYRSLYEAMEYILTVSDRDREAFSSLGLKKPVVGRIGDTRFDQVSQRSIESRNRHVLPPGVFEGKRIVVAGSSWPEDEEHLIPAFLELREAFSDLLLILVPHEPTLEHLERAEFMVNGICPSIRFSNVAGYSGERVIIVDSIGVLMAMYQYAHVAYVGGSFRQGIHNVLEPAVYGIPVIFGPKHQNSQEASALVECGGAVVGNDAGEISAHLRRFFGSERERSVAGAACESFVAANVGATSRFLSYLEKEL
jgi:3-deoxy-D-manno-octulosonic-acid transferase